VIAGYPTESEEDFQKTVELLKRVRPDVVNISMYWEMRGTKAAELKQWPNRMRKERSRIITKLCAQISLANNKAWIGWEGEVLVDEKGKKGTMIGRNYAYKPVVINQGEIGKELKVKIIEAHPHYLAGRVVKN
jgi:tRNA A37 methylthiotransferase MiaB